jgi:hypothetical protein
MRHDRASAILFTAAMIWLTTGAGRAQADLLSEWRFGETGGTVAHDSTSGINGTLFGAQPSTRGPARDRESTAVRSA